MGVQGLSTPYIRDKVNSTNNDVRALAEQNDDLTIAFDMSYFMMKAIHSTPSISSKFHCVPKLPLPELTDKVIHIIKSYFQNGMKKAILVFDGLTPPLKENHAHSKRYANNEQHRMRLSELYAKEQFATELEEKSAIAEVRKLQKGLCSIRRDMVHDVITRARQTFGDSVRCVGSCFEADHQLAALFRQGIVNYVATIDSDLNANSGKCWAMELSTLLTERLPSKFQTVDVEWTHEILCHVTCFLGNDYIHRLYGNGPGKVKDFVKSLSMPGNGSFDSVIREKIDECSTRAELDTNQKKENYFILWKRAYSMFRDGPAFIIHSINQEQSTTDAFFSGNFWVSIGSYRDNSIEFNSLADIGSFGFNPYAKFIDTIDMQIPLETSSVGEVATTDDVNAHRISLLLKECFNMERWPKDGTILKCLDEPTDENGHALYHGSTIDFNIVPIRFQSIDVLKFYLDSRQVKYVNNVVSIKSLVSSIWRSHGSILNPIPKILMRGTAGWVKEEILVRADNCTELNWMKDKELLSSLTKCFNGFTCEKFDPDYGKRNGTRKRVLKHAQGGSIDITMIKATYSLVHKLYTNQKLLVIEAPCAPSQKLKDKNNKNDFHIARLCIKLDENDVFVSYSVHPATGCGCPNGCILCAHLGALICVCYAMTILHDLILNSNNCPDHSNSEMNADRPCSESENDGEDTEIIQELIKYFPRSIHERMKQPIATDDAFCPPWSKTKKATNQYRKQNKMNRKKGKRQKKKKKSQSQPVEEPVNESEDDFGDDSEDDDLREYLSQSHAIPGVLDASHTEMIDVIGTMKEWSEHLMNGRDNRGNKTRSNVESRKHIDRVIECKRSKNNRLRQIKRLDRIHNFLEKHDQKQTQENSIDNDDEDGDMLLLLSLLNVTTQKRDSMQSHLDPNNMMLNSETLNLGKLPDHS